MKDRIKIWTVISLAGLMIEAWALYVVSASPERWRPSLIVRDEPVARTLYDAMLQTMQQARSLSYTSLCSGPDERIDGRITAYNVSLQKPNGLRIEVTNRPSLKVTTLVCDGNNLWIYWDGNRPFLTVDDANGYAKTKSNVYVRWPARPGDLSVGHEITRLGISWYGAILDPSLFLGHHEMAHASLDGVRARGADREGGEDCDVIEASYDRARRVRYYWVSRKDCLPRKIKEVTRQTETHVIVERWSDVALNPELPPQRFTWSPPSDWREWELTCTRDPNAY